MRILYYNWVDFEDAENRGGGVSVYQRNLADAAAAAGDEVSFLSSGIRHGLFSRRPSVRGPRVGAAGVRKFEIVNSTFVSPGHLSFRQDMTRDPGMERAFADFLERHGPFDVVHFNNLEGIPISFLALAKGHAPGARVVYSLHNYFAFCPQVNLWFQEKKNCADFCGGRKCVNCLPREPYPVNAKRHYKLQGLLGRLGLAPNSRLYRFGVASVYAVGRPLYRAVKGLLAGRRGGRPAPAAPRTVPVLDPAAAEHFVRRRQAYVDALNRHADHVLGVSDRVAELAVRFGVRPELVGRLYIGTKFAHVEAPERRPPAADGVLSIAYLGYMRRDKGFYFLLDALERMPNRLAERLRVTVAAKVTDPKAVVRLKRTAHRFAAVTLLDGYTHAALPRVLAGVDLGVVPVLWEDNLPQVAIEFVGSGVPVLTSDLGGARELLNCPELTFRAGSRADFYSKLQGVLDAPSLLRSALAGRAPLWSPREHYEALKRDFYSRPARSPLAEKVPA